MNEQLETAPQCFQELWPDKREYWGSSGAYVREQISTAKSSGKEIRASVFYSKEDAAAYAIKNDGPVWKWSGRPPHKINISEIMEFVRQNRLTGVRVRTYSDGKWITVRKFPAEIPLPEELRD